MLATRSSGKKQSVPGIKVCVMRCGRTCSIQSSLLTSIYNYWALPALLVFATVCQPQRPAQQKPAQIEVIDVQGKRIRPLADTHVRGALLFFIAHDCPISNAYAPEIARICKTYEKRAIATYVVYVERDISPAAASKHARDFRFPCRALLDRERRMVRFAGARMTPEAALVARNGNVVYRGRIDDTHIDYGKRRDEPTTRDLRQALDAFLANKPVARNRTPVIGCYIPDLPK